MLARRRRVWTTQEAIDFAQAAICAEYGYGRKAANDLSAATGLTVETARNVIEGRNAPSLANFLTMLENVPALRAAVRQLLDEHAHPESERFMHEMMTLVQKYMPREAVA